MRIAVLALFVIALGKIVVTLGPEIAVPIFPVIVLIVRSRRFIGLEAIELRAAPPVVAVHRRLL
jgi:hypothetical protein